jgi:uncharacterized protein
MNLSLTEVENLLKTNLKEKNQIAVDTLRGLKTRIQNEQIAVGKELSSDEILKLVQSEAKRRKEAIQAFADGGRAEASEKERLELEVLEQFLPEQISEQEIAEYISAQISEQGWQSSDFGKAMGALKQHFGNNADGATVSKILKEKLQ